MRSCLHQLGLGVTKEGDLPVALIGHVGGVGLSVGQFSRLLAYRNCRGFGVLDEIRGGTGDLLQRRKHERHIEAM